MASTCVLNVDHRPEGEQTILPGDSPGTDGDTFCEDFDEFHGLLTDWPRYVGGLSQPRILLQRLSRPSHNRAFVMSIVTRGSTIESELDKDWSRQIGPSYQCDDNQESTDEFPVCVD